MILPGSASLIISGVQQLIKLGNRLDNLMAQRTAVESQLVLAMPTVRLGDADAQIALVAQALAETAGQQPDPFGSDRALLQQQVAAPTAAFDALFAKYFPDQVSALVVSPDAATLQQLQQTFPGLNWADPGVRIAAFAVAAGQNPQQVSYTARMALAVADTLLEFGADNTALFVRDQKLQGVVQTVLQRFAQPDWSTFTSWQPLLKTALQVSLNAALDAGSELPQKNPWLDGVLDVLVQSRAAVPAGPQQDNYLVGLLQGKGVPLLLSQGLLVASNKLADADAGPFKLIASDVLAAAAPYLQNQADPSIPQFFRDHWGDLLRAGLTSLDKHGSSLLDPNRPLLNGVLTALVEKLATTPNAQFLSSDLLYQLADTAIDVVASNPDQIDDLVDKPWLASFLNAAAQSAQQLTAQKLFTPEAATALLQDAVGVLAKYPNLVVSNQPLPLTLASSIFSAFADLPPDQFSRLDARTIGETTLRSALGAIAANPALVSTKFSPVVSAVATQLAGYVGNGRFTADQAAGLASAAIDAIARNPQIYAGAQNGVATAVLAAVQQALPANSPWAARLLIETARQTLLAVARNGATAIRNQTAAQLQQLLVTVLSAGLSTAANQLGTTTDLDGVPPILGGLVAQALQGKLNAADVAAAETAFTALAEKLSAQV